MKFSIKQSALLQLTQTVSKAVAVRTTKQVLTGILLETTENTLKATAYDLELGIQDEITLDDVSGLKIERTGAIVLPARYLSEVVRKLPLDEVTLTIENNYVAEIQSGQAQFHLHGIDAAEFPTLPTFHQAERIEIPSQILKRLIQCTAFAAASSEVRPILTGIHMQLHDGSITCTATDALRLAYRTVGLETSINRNWDVILPSKSLVELAKILPDDATAIQVQLTDSHSLFAVGSTLFYTRLIDGGYPDTTRIIPTQFRSVVTLPTAEITDAIDRAALIARDRDNNQVRLEVQNESIMVSSSSAEIGNVTEQVGAIEKSGDDLQIAFNGKNVLDALRTIQGEEVTIKFNGSNQPFILQEEGEPQALQLISPVLSR